MRSASGIVSVVVAAALTGGLAACGTSSPRAYPAGPASAGAVPVRVQPNVAGWSGMVQRPEAIYVGMGGAPVARRLAWRHWGSPTAWASGKLDRYWLQPGPVSGWRPTTYTVTVRLRDIQAHNGQLSYRKMAYIYINRQGKTKSLQFQFSIQPGGSVPSWNPTQARTGMKTQWAARRLAWHQGGRTADNSQRSRWIAWAFRQTELRLLIR